MGLIGVLGAGGTGHAIAADLTLLGYDVCLCEEKQFEGNLEDILHQGGIKLEGRANTGFAKIKKVTTDIKETISKSEVIFVAVPASRHEQIAMLCAECLTNHQTIIIGPDNGGTILFAQIFRKMNVNIKYLAGIAGNYYSCRLIGPAHVIVAQPRSKKRIAAFPAKNTDELIHHLSFISSVFDFIPGMNVLEIALSSPNIVTHLAGSILNTGAIEKAEGEYYLYRQGLTPSVLKCISAVAKERLALFEALGYSIAASNLLEKVAKQSEFPELDLFRGLIGPTSMQHRYITEDASTGVALMVSLGQMINIPTPVAQALLTLASAINQRNYLKDGRTVEKLGVSGMNVKQLNQFLFDGSK
jgi:opine dehydrogenase